MHIIISDFYNVINAFIVYYVKISNIKEIKNRMAAIVLKTHKELSYNYE